MSAMMGRIGLWVVAAGALAGVAGVTTPLFQTAPPPQPAAGAGQVAVSIDGPADFAALMRAADAGQGARLFSQCGACHSIGESGPDLEGPNLHGVLGKPIARRRPRYPYTAALSAVGGSWDMRRLDAWLTSPRRFAPGTSMTFPGIDDPRARADLIAFINSQGSHLPLP